MNSSKTVLIAPLNWGLGHASRCVPIIRWLVLQKHNVIIAADGNALSFLKCEFPDEKCIRLADNQLKYFEKFPAWLSILLQLPMFFIFALKEQKRIRKIVEKNQIDVVISDNRYGIRTKKTTNVLISHQLNLNAGILSFIPNTIIKHLISYFNFCLVPDYQTYEDSLAGKLSHPKTIQKTNIEYIEPLSRYEKLNFPESELIPVLISGPEPLKSKLIKQLLSKLKNTSFSYVLFCGNAENYSTENYHNCILKNHDTTQNISTILSQAPLVIASGGYSTIMDMHCLDKDCILIPFRGQTEQEYLAKFHNASAKFSFIPMKDIANKNFSLQEVIEAKLRDKEKSAHIMQSRIPKFQEIISQILEQ
ncbi:MAG: glycosyltransferase [Bacteroidales bacterium]|nr:glycosyltransferase [Bacteroidales bacterium]MDY0216172.1 glycosyltransferase [Bacteroidales bacterium]